MIRFKLELFGDCFFQYFEVFSEFTSELNSVQFVLASVKIQRFQKNISLWLQKILIISEIYSISELFTDGRMARCLLTRTRFSGAIK